MSGMGPRFPVYPMQHPQDQSREANSEENNLRNNSFRFFPERIYNYNGIIHVYFLLDYNKLL